MKVILLFGHITRERKRTLIFEWVFCKTFFLGMKRVFNLIYIALLELSGLIYKYKILPFYCTFSNGIQSTDNTRQTVQPFYSLGDGDKLTARNLKLVVSIPDFLLLTISPTSLSFLTSLWKRMTRFSEAYASLESTLSLTQQLSH